LISRCNCQIFASHCEWGHWDRECRSYWELRNVLTHQGKQIRQQLQPGAHARPMYYVSMSGCWVPRAWTFVLSQLTYSPIAAAVDRNWC